MIERAGETAKLGFKAHPHMLRHATGYALANAGHADTPALPRMMVGTPVWLGPAHCPPHDGVPGLD